MSVVRPILGVDIDNVLAATDDLIRRLFAEMFGVRLQRADIVYFDYWRCGVTKEQEQQALHRFHTCECGNVLPMDGAIDALGVLRPHYEIHVVTGRPPATVKATQDWLARYGVPYDRLDFVVNKAESSVDFHAFIDDKRETVYAMAARGVRALLFDAPWNQPDGWDPPGVVRVRSWEEGASCLLESLPARQPSM